MSYALTLIPAYGRDYKSIKQVKHDWSADKDFRICDMSCADDGRYINKTDAEGSDIKRVVIRYQRLTKQTFIEVKGSGS